MCNEQARRVAAGLLRDDIQQLRIPLRFPEGVPNLEPTPSIRITDRNAILRAAPEGGAELVVRRWSWPGPRGKPVYNFRSEGRHFANNRCLIVADEFYEFTDPDLAPGEPKAKRKQKWGFTMRDGAWFCIAGIWRDDPAVGEAYTMLTTDAGPDVRPYHHRQVIVPPRAAWARWLDPAANVDDLLAPSPAGTFAVAPAR